MALIEIDRTLLERCLQRKPRSWNEFVDRFMGLVVHVINHSASTRGITLSPQDRDDLVAEVFLALVANDFAVLRHFRGQSSLATYLTVVARRVVVRELLRHRTALSLSETADPDAIVSAPDLSPNAEQQYSDREQIERLLGELDEAEAEVVRLYHLEGRSYYEISLAVGMPENSIGPMLSRARVKLRQASAKRTVP